MQSRLIQMQVKAFAALFVVLLGIDAFAYHGEYRMWVGHGIASAFSSVHGLGPGRDWGSRRN